MEDGTRHFYAKAMQAKQNNIKSEIVDHYMQKAIEVAEKVAPSHWMQRVPNGLERRSTILT